MIFRNHSLTILVTGYLVLFAIGLGGVEAAVVYDEAVDGELSDRPDRPTEIDFQVGSNSVMGSTQRSNEDYFRMSLLPGLSIESISLEAYDTVPVTDPTFANRTTLSVVVDEIFSIYELWDAYGFVRFGNDTVGDDLLSSMGMSNGNFAGSLTDTSLTFAVGDVKDTAWQLSFHVTGKPSCEFFSLGDVDCDGSIGFPDFMRLSETFGTIVEAGSEADFDFNGSVEFVDFLVLSQNFGKTPQAAAVPEPTSTLGALIPVIWLLGLRKSVSRLTLSFAPDLMSLNSKTISQPRRSAYRCISSNWSLIVCWSRVENLA